MTRDADLTALGAAQEEVYRDAALVFLDYASGPVRVASTPFNITVDTDGDLVPETFKGVGALGSIGAVEEGVETRPYSLTLTLRGVRDEDFALTLLEVYQGRAAKIWVVFLDEEHKVKGEPINIFDGRIDTQDLIPKNGAINVTVQSRLADWERPGIRRYTNEDQQDEFPGDKGLQFVHQMKEKPLPWGSG